MSQTVTVPADQLALWADTIERASRQLLGPAEIAAADQQFAELGRGHVAV